MYFLSAIFTWIYLNRRVLQPLRSGASGRVALGGPSVYHGLEIFVKTIFEAIYGICVYHILTTEVKELIFNQKIVSVFNLKQYLAYCRTFPIASSLPSSAKVRWTTITMHALFTPTVLIQSVQISLWHTCEKLSAFLAAAFWVRVAFAVAQQSRNVTRLNLKV